MGILNVTPDSFFDGGKFTNEKNILLRTEEIISEGGDIIDIGGVSTRPNAPDVSEEEELKRLIPAIKLVRKKFPSAIISADTFRSKVAEEAINAGADMINDISGGSVIVSGAKQSHSMFETIAKLKVPYVLMHIQGTPQMMQKNPHYKNVVKEVKKYFSEKISRLQKIGVTQIIIDPGFGFGKNLEHNYTLLKNLSEFKSFGLPILVGISRKGMIQKVLGINPEEALNGTTAANTIALMNGANILRVHDVKEAKEAVKIFNFTQKS
ncbi:MAG: dihydropteroate synthase [Bacteroidetes bacterium]|nr:dihydropteroate synthase [Bacteroidota bacterium]